MACWFCGARRALATLIAAATVVGTGIVWLLATLLVLRGSARPCTSSTPLDHADDVGGHAGFRFFWTANSLALFGLLAIACVAVGRGLVRSARRVLDSGDRLLVAALVFALVALKSGLTRADLLALEPTVSAAALRFSVPAADEARWL